MPEMTTIKVPKELRDAVMSGARAESLTAAQFLDRVMREHARRLRLVAVREAYAAAALDVDYVETTEAWDATSADGLDGLDRA